MSVYKPGDKVRINLSDPEKRGVRGCFHGREGRVSEIDQSIGVLLARDPELWWFDPEEVELVESQEVLVRADLEALQAAVRGLMGREGTVAEMISELADIGRTLGAVRDVAAGLMGKPAPNDRVVVAWIQHVAAQHRELGEMALEARADREALERRIQGAMVALDALRGAWQSCESADVRQAFEALERALRGVVPATIEHESGEKLVVCAECPTPRPWAVEVENKLAEQGDLIKRLAERVTALEGGVRARGGGAREVLHAGDPAAGDRDAKR